MADIQFEEEQQYRRDYKADEKSPFIRLVLATGIVSTDRQAEYVLVGFSVIAIIVSLFLFFNSGTTPQKPSSASLEQEKQFMNNVPVNRN